MTKIWQECVAVHHINGSPWDNRPENLAFFHAATRMPLTDQELDDYRDWLLDRAKQRQAFDPLIGRPAGK